MLRYQAKEELEKLVDKLLGDDCDEEDEIIDALQFAIADMETLQNVIYEVKDVEVD